MVNKIGCRTSGLESNKCNLCQYISTAVTTNPIYPTLPLGQDMTQGQFLSGV